MKRLVWIAVMLTAAQLIAQDSLPAGPGKQLVLDTCVQCHDFKWITGQKKSEAEWHQTVNMMIWRGAPLMPGEAATIAKYLAESRGGPASAGRSAKAGPPELPQGKGRDLVAGQCVQCHDLAVTTDARKSLPEWRHSVDEMVRLGARLTGSEIEVVARYLAKSFGTAQ